MIRAARRMEGVERTLIRRIFDSAPPDAINLGLGQPDLPTPGVVALSGIAAIAAGRTAYTSTAGDPGLREAVAAEYAPFAQGPESVVIHVGTQEAFFATALALLDPDSELLYPDPGYPAYPVVARLIGASPKAYPLRPERDFEPDPDDIESRLTDRTRAVVLCSPGNPTGAVARAEDLVRLATLLERREIAWISDEIYGAFTYDGPLPSISAVSREGGVVISGLSKSLSMTGWRIGWTVGPPALIERIIAVHQYLVTCAPTPSQHAARQAFTAAGRAETERYREVFSRRRQLMARELARIEGLSFSLPRGAFYFFVDVRRFGSSLELAREILDRRGVITIPGEAFGTNGRGFLRLSYAASDDHIVRGVRAIGEVLAQAG